MLNVFCLLFSVYIHFICLWLFFYIFIVRSSPRVTPPSLCWRQNSGCYFLLRRRRFLLCVGCWLSVESSLHLCLSPRSGAAFICCFCFCEAHWKKCQSSKELYYTRFYSFSFNLIFEVVFLHVWVFFRRELHICVQQLRFHYWQIYDKIIAKTAGQQKVP